MVVARLFFRRIGKHAVESNITYSNSEVFVF